MKAVYGQPSYEVARARDVDWVPAIPGQAIDGSFWAYRIKTPTGNTIIGAIRGTKAAAVDTARRYIDRAMFHQPYWAASRKKGKPRESAKNTKRKTTDTNDITEDGEE